MLPYPRPRSPWPLGTNDAFAGIKRRPRCPTNDPHKQPKAPGLNYHGTPYAPSTDWRATLNGGLAASQLRQSLIPRAGCPQPAVHQGAATAG